MNASQRALNDMLINLRPRQILPGDMPDDPYAALERQIEVARRRSGFSFGFDPPRGQLTVIAPESESADVRELRRDPVAWAAYVVIRAGYTLAEAEQAAAKVLR